MSNVENLRESKDNSTLLVKYKDIDIKANLIYRKRKTITIQIKPKDKITVISPKSVPKKIIKDMLVEKGDWILKKLDEYKDREEFYEDKKFITGDKLFYLGDEYTLEVRNNYNINNLNRVGCSVFIEGSKIIVKTSDTSKECIKKHLKEWYKKESERIVLERLVYCRENLDIMIQLIPSVLKVKEQKKRWGTCTSKRAIYINSKISMAIPEAIDYILVHEFSHLVHMNHSKDFYNLVERIMPNYKQYENWLKENSYKLTL